MDRSNEGLDGIPGVGPSRRAALEAAGITSRAMLARMSVDQLISLTGMPRAQAERALSAAMSDGSGAGADATSPLPPTDDAFPPGAVDEARIAVMLADDDTLEVANHAAPGEPVLPDEDQNPTMAARAQLDRATARVRTALSDVTRIWDAPKLERSLGRLATTVDRLDRPTVDALRRKWALRLADRLDRLASWLENAIARAATPPDRRHRGIRERLRADRQYIEQLARVAAKQAKGKKKRASGGKGKSSA